jgi:hypothetical protein
MAHQKASADEQKNKKTSFAAGVDVTKSSNFIILSFHYLNKYHTSRGQCYDCENSFAEKGEKLSFFLKICTNSHLS